MMRKTSEICVPLRSRLIWTFFLWFLLAMTVTLAGTAGVVALVAYNDFEESANRIIRREAYLWRNITGKLLEAGVTEGEFREIMAPLIERESVSATLWGNDGKVILHLSPPNTSIKLPVPGHIRQLVAEGKEHIKWKPGIVEVALPIERSDGTSGGVYVVIDHHHSRNRGFFNHPERMWVGLAALLVLGWLICWPLAVHLARPLRQAAEAANALGRGDLSARINLTRGHFRRKQGARGEIGMLAESFNTMAENLQQLLEGHKQLLADISHELRTPLARQEVALELARGSDGKQEEYLDAVARQAARMEELIGELLSYSRLDMAPYQLQREAISPGELFTEAVALHGEDATGRELVITQTGPALAQSLLVDRRLVLRAVENALRNAIRHSPDGGTITLSAQKTVDGLELIVTDEGDGVEQEHRERIFQPFYRTDTARSPGQGGVGLGLAIARRCLEAHGGTTRAEPGENGKGLRLVFWLPLTAMNDGTVR